MRIAIIGAGNVGGGLGTALAAAGHEIVFGVRDPDSDKTRVALDTARGSSAADPAVAVDGADVVVFALRWDVVPDTVAALPSLAGRIVIDAMNRIASPARATSATEDLAGLLPGAKLVKCFNTIGFENLTTARDRAVRAAMFAAGDDPEAKGVALDLAAQIGFDAHDAGPLANAKVLEDMVKVWFALTQVHGRRVGFAISKG
jgi:predicted dinucleotide-binding enzyme